MISLDMYTDGACKGNPGPGGWAVIVRSIKKGKTITLSGAVEHTTANEMELTAAVEALRFASNLGKTKLKITVDAKYVLHGVRSWIAGWKTRGWRKSDGHAVAHLKLWKELDKLRADHRIEWCWVPSHSGHKYNELADKAAKAAIVDAGYRK